MASKVPRRNFSNRWRNPPTQLQHAIDPQSAASQVFGNNNLRGKILDYRTQGMINKQKRRVFTKLAEQHAAGQEHLKQLRLDRTLDQLEVFQ